MTQAPVPYQGPPMPPPWKQRVAIMLANGGAIINETPDYITVRQQRKPANHALHLILTLVTCGVWGIAWIIATIQSTKTNDVTIQKWS